MEKKNIYCFIYDENRDYYRAKQQHDGNYTITKNNSFFPIEYNPTNLLKSTVEFATNMEYFSMVRSINYALDFIKDGAAILRHLYFLGKSVEQKAYLTIIEWNGSNYELSYTGRFEFSQKDEDPKSGIFTVPLVDDSAWGVLSRYDKVQFAFDCSEHNPKAVRVLIDGLTLENTATFQTSNIRLVATTGQHGHTLPFIIVNQDGDSSGLVLKNQSYSQFDENPSGIPPNNFEFLYSSYNIDNVNISGTYTFIFNRMSDVFTFQILQIYFITSTNQRHNLFMFNDFLANGSKFSVDFDFNINIASGERLFLASLLVGDFSITPVITNIKIKTKTVPEPVVRYGIRAGDLLQQIVNKATYGRYTINSEFFTVNNKSVVISGDAIRGVKNAELYTSFDDFFKTFDAINWMALRNVLGQIWMEKATEVYKNSGVLIDLGEAIDFKPIPANDFYCNEVQVGSPKQDLRHPSGRLAFNSTNTFSLQVLSSNKKLDIVTKYITDCYAIIFLLLDYQGDSSTDNKGDKSIYLLDITDEQGTAVDNIETFENINVDNTILEPIIKSPLNNDVITYNKPIIRGISQPGATVNIYYDTILDGSTVADSDGNWIYSFVASLQSYDGITHTGVHVIQATFTDLGAANSSISITINTTVTTPTKIIYPLSGDNLYNNKPLIKGIAQKDQNIDIFIDGVLVNSTVADASCKWEYKSTVLFNGDHTLQVDAEVITFHVDTNVSHPLITYIGSELYGFALINNLPLIEGVSKPLEYVTVWINYVSYQSLGTVRADANGNWSLQVSATTYRDPISGAPIILAPIQNGLNVISTSLINYTVGINVQGYKLNRPNYTSISGVIDNTVFNTNFSPKRMLENRYPLFAAILRNQPQEFLYAQTFGQNGNLVTNLNGVIVNERADVSTSELGQPFAILEYAKIKVKSLKSYIKTLYDFSNGGIIKVSFRGKNFFALCIGSMKMSSIVDTEQEWKVLLSTLTSYIDLLNLFNNGLTIKLDNMSFYRSDRNSLHFVEYNFQQNPKYNSKTIYQDWFNNRNSDWINNPLYIQKFQTSETEVRDQIIAKGFSSAILKMYSCFDASLIDSIPYNPVGLTPVQPPEVVLEAVINFSLYPVGQYFFVFEVSGDTDIPILISERVEIREHWNKTLLIESSSSINETGAFFSTGFKTIIRVEGLIKKFQPDIDTIVSTDDIGNTKLLYSSNRKKAEIRFGTPRGLPDYLYLKIADAITLDNLNIDNNSYTINKDEKIQPIEEFEGHPMYYYKATLYPQENKRGYNGQGVPDTTNDSVVLVVDAIAFGLPTGSLVNINLTNG